MTASFLECIIALVVLCFVVRTFRKCNFHAFAMVCLAAVMMKHKSLNGQWVTDNGCLFRRATVGPGAIGVSERVDRI